MSETPESQDSAPEPNLQIQAANEHAVERLRSLVEDLQSVKEHEARVFDSHPKIRVKSAGK
jgi:hypothetical protein